MKRDASSQLTGPGLSVCESKGVSSEERVRTAICWDFRQLLTTQLAMTVPKECPAMTAVAIPSASSVLCMASSMTGREGTGSQVMCIDMGSISINSMPTSGSNDTSSRKRAT